MTYTLINIVFLGAVVVIAAVAVILVARRRRPGIRLAAVAIGAGVVLAMTAIFDNVMIGVGLVAYDEQKISGLFLGLAPIEDFAYAIAAIILLPSLWVILGPREPSVRKQRG